MGHGFAQRIVRLSREEAVGKCVDQAGSPEVVAGGLMALPDLGADDGNRPRDQVPDTLKNKT
jgi:hypothetical protein